MTAIVCRSLSEAGSDQRRSWLFFSDGLIVDPGRSIGILAYKHWQRVDRLVVPGEPNAECGRPKAAVA